LTDVTVYWTTPLSSINADAFSGITPLSNVTLNVPSGTQSAYRDAAVWQDFFIEGGGNTSTAPANDLCANATDLPCGATVSGTLAGATPTSIYAEGTLNDVFYKFTASIAGTYIITLAKTNPSDDIDLQLFEGCGSTTGLTEIINNSTTETVTYTCTAGTAYRIRILDITGTGGSFTVKVTCPDPSSNDLCSNATNLPCGATVSGTLAGATPTSIYDDGTFNDVFYKFTTSDAGDYTITLSQDNISYDIDMQLFEGCGSTTRLTEIFNNHTTETVTYTCTAATTYLVRILDIIATGGSFTVKVGCPATEGDATTWEIGNPNAADVTATFNNGTLTISGTGAMQDWGIMECPGTA
jgi:hypothetical protein